MAGCFGSSQEDRYFERQLDNYLDSLDGPPDNWEFSMKVPGSGSIVVKLAIDDSWDIDYMHWSFEEEAEVTLEDFDIHQEDAICDRCEEEYQEALHV